MCAPANTILLREGTISRKIFLIKKGCVRTWFCKEDKEITFQFFFEGDVVSSAESFRANKPSIFSIETIETTELLWLDKADMDIIKQDFEFYDYIIQKAGARQAEFMKHFFSYLANTPLERYEYLLNKRPEIIARVPLQYVASYLGITQVSLSRIRKRIMRE